MSRGRRAAAACAVLAVFVCVGVAAAHPGTARPAGPAGQPPTAHPWSPSYVRTCLRAHGATLGAVPRDSVRFSFLHDLAQQNSFLARVRSSRVGVAVTPSVANAELLVELLSMPGNSFVIERRDNVVLLAPRASTTALRVALDCVSATKPSTSAPEAAHVTPWRALAFSALADDAPIYTVAGNGVSGDTGDGGPAIQAAIDRPRSLAELPDGSILEVEPFQEVVRRIWPDGHITRFAGTGVAGYSGDGGPATQAKLNLPHAASVLPSGAVLIADNVNNRIREVLPNGTITTVAGTGTAGFSGDGGPATSAKINAPRGVVALPDGGFLIPDSNNQRVRRVSPNGTITTVAGNGVQGYSGDGGPATQAKLNIPFGVSPLPDGGFLVDDVANHRIRRVWPNGTITTVAGNGVPGYSGDGGPATLAELYNPHNVWATSDGGFLIADASNSRIRRVAADGTITTAVGTGNPAFSGDGGPAVDAEIAYPKAMIELSSGALLVADTSNNRIRYVGDPVAPVSLGPPSVSGQPLQGSTLTASTGAWSAIPPPSYTYRWQRCNSSGGACADIGSATAAAYTATSADVGSTLRVVVTASNPAGSASAASAVTATIGSSTTAPVNTAAPSVGGSAQVGQVLTASNGSWDGSPTGYAYQWQKAQQQGGPFSDIGGATGSSYTPIDADQDAYLRVAVTASNAAGSTTATSAPVGPVAAAAGQPVTVSFSVAASGDDGDIGVRAPLSGGWPPSGTAAPYTTGSYFTVGKRNAFGNYEVFDGLIRIDTSSLPDNAQISSATLTIYTVGKADGDARGLIGSWYSAANWPIDAADWTLDAGTSALTGTPLSTLATNTTATLSLQNPGQISTTGQTALRLGLSGGAPSKDNYLQIAARDGSKPPAKLTITYTLP